MEDKGFLFKIAFIDLNLKCPIGHTTDPEQVKEMMLEPIVDELTPREPFDGCMILQGGIPEVEEFMGSLKL